MKQQLLIVVRVSDRRNDQISKYLKEGYMVKLATPVLSSSNQGINSVTVTSEIHYILERFIVS